jgi:hypothetical protein
MWLETNVYLLGTTFVVSLLHSVFEMLAFKNDIAFWKDKDSLEGISVKSLYMQLGMSIVIFLYLMDNETSVMIWAPSGLSILLDIWKIKKSSKFTKIETFPYFKLEDSDSYTNSTTK